jgi:hypothetical protein
MKKRILCVALAFLLVIALIPASSAKTPAKTAADNLFMLGLFQGVGTNADGTPNFALDRAPTRAEAVTMLVRLLGKESAAKSGAFQTPFTDVPDWATPYVGYAYENKLTNGVSATAFGSNSPVTAAQYLTFVLRALGYEDGTDFTWSSAWTLSDKLGFTSGEYNANTKSFTRGDAASVSYDALFINGKSSGKPLYETLIDEGAFTKNDAKNAGLTTGSEEAGDKEITGVTVSPTTVSLAQYESRTLTATVLPTDAKDRSVTWTTSNSAVATVSASGIVTAAAKGSATVTARASNGMTASCYVTVSEDEEGDSNGGTTTIKRPEQIVFGGVRTGALTDGIQKGKGAAKGPGGEWFTAVELWVAIELQPGRTVSKITWTTSAPGVVRIDGVMYEKYTSLFESDSEHYSSQYKVTTVGPGTATITATVTLNDGTTMSSSSDPINVVSRDIVINLPTTPMTITNSDGSSARLYTVNLQYNAALSSMYPGYHYYQLSLGFDEITPVEGMTYVEVKVNYPKYGDKGNNRIVVERVPIPGSYNYPYFYYTFESLYEGYTYNVIVTPNN